MVLFLGALFCFSGLFCFVLLCVVVFRSVRASFASVRGVGEGMIYKVGW